MDLRLLLTIAFIVHLFHVSCGWRAWSKQLVINPKTICHKVRRLRGKQNVICQKEPEIKKAIVQGAQMAIQECQYQFRNRRWNCTRERRSMKKILMKDTRETGFVNAITSAGVSFSVTKACSLGSSISCYCDPTKLPDLNITDRWEWAGCDNFQFGYLKSKEFLDDWFRKRRDFKAMLLSHNYEAGRLAVTNSMRIICKCHGMSGTCNLKTCWHKLPHFRKVGDLLKKQFDGAVKVMAGNDGKRFIPEGATIKDPRKQDIVYSEESPNYCLPNKKIGSLGTRGRECNRTSMGVEGCKLLCCERGHETKEYIIERDNCNCRFYYCCKIKCQICHEKRTVSHCL